LVVVVDIRGFESTIFDGIIYYITSIISAVHYNTEGRRIVIFEKLSCYMEDSYLYFGDDSYGFEKYRLDSTFFADSVMRQ
jgi:hypothetical protein